MCAACHHWTKGTGGLGRCNHPSMRIKFTPYTMKPFSFEGTLEEFNRMQKPAEKPLTSHDYSCGSFTPYRR